MSCGATASFSRRAGREVSEQSSRGIECKCAAGLKSKQKAWRESGDDKVISSERNEHKCMIMLKRRL